MFTQASQIRLAQRNIDAGKWIAPEVRIEECDPFSIDDWVDVSDSFDGLGCSMTSQGGQVGFSFTATRVNLTGGGIYRLVFPSREDTISTPQMIGNLVIVSTVPAVGDEEDHRTWAVYTLLGLPSGRLEPLDPYYYVWPEPTVGDVIQFFGTWFI